MLFSNELTMTGVIVHVINTHINHVAILQPLTIPNKFIFVFCKNIFFG